MESVCMSVSMSYCAHAIGVCLGNTDRVQNLRCFFEVPAEKKLMNDTVVGRGAGLVDV
jgi:hypothetical protein